MFRKMLAVVVLTALLLVSVIEGKNRFNVMSYSDHYWTVNKLQYYTWFKDFKLSAFQTYDPLAAGTYLLDSVGDTVALYTQHWRKPPGYDEIIYISDDSTVDLFNSAVDCHNGRMQVRNTDVVKGYSSISVVGHDYPDVGRLVIRALAGVNPPGLLHDRFEKGIFETSHTAMNTEVTYSALMRLPDITGDTNTVVAQLIVEDRRQNESGWIDCKQNTTNPYSATRYNDTLLIVGSASGLDTVPAINPSSSDSIRVAVHACQTEEYDDGDFVKFAPGTIPDNICYEVNNGGSIDTICTMPYRFVKDIRLADFPTDTGYYQVSTKAAIGGSWRRVAWKVYWTGQKTVYLDSLFVYNEKGYTYDTLVSNHMPEITGNIQDWYDAHPLVKGRIQGIYSQDEVKGMDMQMVERVSRIADNVAEFGSEYPGDFLATLGAYNGPTENAWDGQYFDSYLYYSHRDHFIFDFYQFYCYFSSSSDEPDTTNIQRLINWYTHQMSIARTRASATGSDYWIIIPVFDEWVKSSDGTYYVQHIRKPTPREVWALVNLALVHGAKGVGYWKLTGSGAEESSSTRRSRSDYYYALSGALVEDFSDIDDAMVSAGCATSPTQPYTGFGALLADPPSHVVYKNDLFDSVAVVNAYLDSMAYFFNNAIWRSAGSWTDNVKAMTGSFIDSVRSMRYFAHNDSAFLQVAFFGYQNQDYAYIVNRRVDNSSPGTVIDTQTVRVFMSGQGAYQVWDVYANHCDTVWDSCGVVRWNHFLNPGAAVLIKRAPISMKGAWAGTWPQYSTIKVVGDVTVNSGTTLTVQSGNVTVLPNTDSLSSGSDTHKIEFIVNGTLILLGTPTNRIVIQPTNPAIDSCWRGIKTASFTSKLYADNIVIKKAYTGLEFHARKDTVKNSRIEDCFMNGMVSYGLGCYMEKDTFWSNNTFYGGALSKFGMQCGTKFMYTEGNAVKLKDCFIKGVKYPVSVTGSYTVILDNCKITADAIANATPVTSAVTVDSYSILTLKNCLIENYKTGATLLYHSTLNIDSCKIGSTVMYAPIDHTPMHIGVSGDSSGVSVCKVRNSCFNHIRTNAVFRRWGTFDLGTSTEAGNNRFMMDTVRYYDHVYDCPDVVVYNTGGTTVDARGNHWDELLLPLANHVTSGVDTVGRCYTFHDVPCLRCDEYQGEWKIAAADSAGMNSVDTFSVDQNYPNPFNPMTQIRFNLPDVSYARIEVFNVLGQRIVTVADQEFGEGEHVVKWDGRGSNGEAVSSGIYFYRVIAGENIQTRKMMLLK